MQKKALQIEIHYAFAQTLYWAAAICLQGFTSMLLSYQGFSNSQTGITVSITSITSIALQLFLSNFCDKHPEIPLKKIIAAMALISFALVAIICVKKLPLLLLAVFFILSDAPQKAINGLLNALMMQYVNKGIPVRYGWPRGVGSMGWAFGGLIMGRLIAKNTPNILWFIFLVFDILAIISYLLMPGSITSEKKKKTGSHTSSYKEMLSNNSALVIFLISLIVMGIGQSSLSTFLNRTVEAVGGGAKELGIAILIQSGMELPVMFLSSLLLRKWNGGQLLFFSFCCYTIKTFALAFCTSLTMLYIIMFNGICCYGIYGFASVFFVNSIVEDDQKVRGQALVSLCYSSGIGGVIGNILGGILIDYLGLRTLYFVSGFLAIIAIFLMLLCLKKSAVKLKKNRV